MQPPQKPRSARSSNTGRRNSDDVGNAAINLFAAGSGGGGTRLGSATAGTTTSASATTTGIDAKKVAILEKYGIAPDHALPWEKEPNSAPNTVPLLPHYLPLPKPAHMPPDDAFRSTRFFGRHLQRVMRQQQAQQPKQQELEDEAAQENNNNRPTTAPTSPSASAAMIRLHQRTTIRAPAPPPKFSAQRTYGTAVTGNNSVEQQQQVHRGTSHRTKVPSLVEIARAIPPRALTSVDALKHVLSKANGLLETVPAQTVEHATLVLPLGAHGAEFGPQRRSGQATADEVVEFLVGGIGFNAFREAASRPNTQQAFDDPIARYQEEMSTPMGEQYSSSRRRRRLRKDKLDELPSVPGANVVSEWLRFKQFRIDDGGLEIGDNRNAVFDRYKRDANTDPNANMMNSSWAQEQLARNRAANVRWITIAKHHAIVKKALREISAQAMPMFRVLRNRLYEAAKRSLRGVLSEDEIELILNAAKERRREAKLERRRQRKMKRQSKKQQQKTKQQTEDGSSPMAGANSSNIDNDGDESSNTSDDEAEIEHAMSMMVQRGSLDFTTATTTADNEDDDDDSARHPNSHRDRIDGARRSFDLLHRIQSAYRGLGLDADTASFQAVKEMLQNDETRGAMKKASKKMQSKINNINSGARPRKGSSSVGAAASRLDEWSFPDSSGDDDGDLMDLTSDDDDYDGRGGRGQQHRRRGRRGGGSSSSRSRSPNNNSTQRTKNKQRKQRAGSSGVGALSRAQLAQLQDLVAADPHKFSKVVAGGSGIEVDQQLGAVTKALEQMTGMKVLGGSGDPIALARVILDKTQEVAESKINSSNAQPQETDGNAQNEQQEQQQQQQRRSPNPLDAVAGAAAGKFLSKLSSNNSSKSLSSRRNSNATNVVEVAPEELGLSLKQHIVPLISKLNLLDQGFKRSLALINVVAGGGEIYHYQNRNQQLNDAVRRQSTAANNTNNSKPRHSFSGETPSLEHASSSDAGSGAILNAVGGGGGGGGRAMSVSSERSSSNSDRAANNNKKQQQQFSSGNLLSFSGSSEILSPRSNVRKRQQSVSASSASPRRHGSNVSANNNNNNNHNSSPAAGSFRTGAVAAFAVSAFQSAARDASSGEYRFKSSDPAVPNTGNYYNDMFLACERASQALRKINDRVTRAAHTLRQRRRRTQAMIDVRNETDKAFAVAAQERERRAQLQGSGGGGANSNNSNNNSAPPQYEHRRCILDRVPAEVRLRLFGNEADLLRESRRNALFAQLLSERTLSLLHQMEQPVYGDGSGDRRLAVAQRVIKEGVRGCVDDAALLRDVNEAEQRLREAAQDTMQQHGIAQCLTTSSLNPFSGAAAAVSSSSAASSPRRGGGRQGNRRGGGGDVAAAGGFQFDLDAPRAHLISTVDIGALHGDGLRDVGVQNCIEDERTVKCYEVLDRLRGEELTTIDTIQSICNTAANLTLLVEAIESNMTCPRCLQVIRQPQIIAPCGTTVCRCCVLASDDQRLDEIDAGFSYVQRAECGCQVHEGTAVNRGIDTMLALWPDMKVACARLNSALNEITSALHREQVTKSNATAEHLARVKAKADISLDHLSGETLTIVDKRQSSKNDAASSSAQGSPATLSLAASASGATLLMMKQISAGGAAGIAAGAGTATRSPTRHLQQATPRGGSARRKSAW